MLTQRVNKKKSIITNQCHCHQFVEKHKRLLFNSFHEYVENNILSVHQSGVQSNDSCANYLSSVVHNLYKAFEAYPNTEVRGVFLDMSKMFY